ncbi:hypothetical protein B0H14DRAFT_2675322 [Mycena olivaceomarginata]|nr:hypothetical protein B0H14DRAFT_2675322 [Mycena olivaceomarginata]
MHTCLLLSAALLPYHCAARPPRCCPASAPRHRTEDAIIAHISEHIHALPANLALRRSRFRPRTLAASVLSVASPRLVDNAVWYLLCRASFRPPQCSISHPPFVVILSCGSRSLPSSICGHRPLLSTFINFLCLSGVSFSLRGFFVIPSS